MRVVRRVWSSPVALLLIAVALLTAIIQSGEMGTADTTRRLQVTHSLWTGAPQVAKGDYPDFGIPGRGGRLYAWYGIGQSLLMLPSDVAGTALAHAPWWRGYVRSRATPQVRAIVVSVSTNVLLNVLTALVALRFLELLGFSRVQSICGCAGAGVCDDASALCAEYAGEQLHFSADADGDVAAVAVGLVCGAGGADWRAEVVVVGSGGAGVESADADYDGAGCDGCGAVSCCWWECLRGVSC